MSDTFKIDEKAWWCGRPQCFVVYREDARQLERDAKRAEADRDREQNLHAELQARCYEGYPSASDGVFDYLKSTEAELRESQQRCDYFQGAWNRAVDTGVEFLTSAKTVEAKNDELDTELCKALVDVDDLSKKNTLLTAQNDTLRGLLGNSAKDCTYCGLPAAEQARCKSGFPGCSRADDQQLGEYFASGYEAECLRKENALLTTLVARLADNLTWILPLAKGYAAANKVGSNQRYCDLAEQTLVDIHAETEKLVRVVEQAQVGHYEKANGHCNCGLCCAIRDLRGEKV